MYQELHECLACGNKNLTSVLDLGNQPLANSYRKDKSEPLPEFPLEIKKCDSCSHVQLSVSVDPDLMFKDYLYVSGTSKTMMDHFSWFAGFTKEYHRLLSNKTGQINVLDIGCNDGSQLDKFKDIGCNTSGIDPAENLYEESSKKHHIICDYFNKSTNKVFGIPDIIVAQNVFAHNYDPLEFMKNVGEIMNENSLFFVQTSQANMILNNEFDTIYHEHISFYNIKSMDALCRRAGLNLIDVVKCPLHGKSYIFIISRSKHRDYHIGNLIEMETVDGLYSDSTYEKYTKNCKEIINNFKKIIEEYKSEGYQIIGYGAAAKGNTFLNAAKAKMDFIIDDNPLKHGYYTPGTDIEIVPLDILTNYKESDKILFVPLAWNFFKEIKSKIKGKRNNENDRFLLYFPQIRIES